VRYEVGVVERGLKERHWEGNMVDRKLQIITRLLAARDEIQNAIWLATPIARYDPVLMPQATRDQLSGLREDLERVIRNFEEEK